MIFLSVAPTVSLTELVTVFGYGMLAGAVFFVLAIAVAAKISEKRNRSHDPDVRASDDT